MEDNAAQPPAVVGTIVNTLTLPSGGTVVLRDYRELRAGDRRAVQKAITDLDHRMSAALDLLDGTICMLVESWSLPYLPNAPLPRVDPSILGKLEIPDAVALEEAADPVMKVLFPPKITAENAMEPGGPTRPS